MGSIEAKSGPSYVKHTIVVKWQMPSYTFRTYIYTGCPNKQYPRLVNNRTSVFGLTFRIYSVLGKAYPNLNFQINTAEIGWKPSEICYFEVDREVDHSTLTSQILAILGKSIFRFVTSPL